MWHKQLTTNLSSHYKENLPKLSISDDRIENVDTFQHVKYKKPLEMVTEIQKQIRLAPAELTFAIQCGELRGTGRHANCDQHVLSLSSESQDSSTQLRSKAPCDRAPAATSWTFLFGLFPSPVLTQGIWEKGWSSTLGTKGFRQELLLTPQPRAEARKGPTQLKLGDLSFNMSLNRGPHSSTGSDPTEKSTLSLQLLTVETDQYPQQLLNICKSWGLRGLEPSVTLVTVCKSSMRGRAQFCNSVHLSC